jgi:hypothetical protein
VIAIMIAIVNNAVINAVLISGINYDQNFAKTVREIQPQKEDEEGNKQSAIHNILFTLIIYCSPVLLQHQLPPMIRARSR